MDAGVAMEFLPRTAGIVLLLASQCLHAAPAVPGACFDAAAASLPVQAGEALARIDGHRLTLLGRRKDMFIRGTQNVYPGLYEPLIAGLPGVSDAAMVGVPDEIGDDRIVVAVVAIVRRRRDGTVDVDMADPDTVMRLEMERATAVETLARSGPTGENPHV